MPLEQLPDELLLQIALSLPDSLTPRHLKSLSLTSRKLRSIAQEALFTTAKLHICCGCHPKVNALIKLLRTLLDRPDLASKVKTLRFRAVRKRVEKLYAEQDFDLGDLRKRCILKLRELGYQQTHPWWKSINNSIESAFGGLLLALLPNLADLDFWVKDHQRGPPSSECISGLWGGASPPEAILHEWKKIGRLITGDTSVFKCGINFEALTALDLRTISIGTVLRLNGPGSLQGAENIKNLALTISIQFADRPLVEKAEIEFGDLLEALACNKLKVLKITFINDGYHIGDDLTTELDGGFFLNQLNSVQETLESLSITIETTDDDGELDWLLDMFHRPISSMAKFSALKSLVIPQVFLFTFLTPESCDPSALPPELQRLELLWPREIVEEWAEGFVEKNHKNLSASQFNEVQNIVNQVRTLVLTCRDDVGVGAAYFTEDLHPLWIDLWVRYGFEIEVYDQLRNTRENLATIFEEGRLLDQDSESDDDLDGYDDLEKAKEATETKILAHLRQSRTRQPDGLTLRELSSELDIDRWKTHDAVRGLHTDGSVLAPNGFVEGARFQYLETSFGLHQQDVIGGVQDILDGMPAGSSGQRYDRPERSGLLVGDDGDDTCEDYNSTDDDMPDLEPIYSLSSFAGPAPP